MRKGTSAGQIVPAPDTFGLQSSAFGLPPLRNDDRCRIEAPGFILGFAIPDGCRHQDVPFEQAPGRSQNAARDKGQIRAETIDR